MTTSNNLAEQCETPVPDFAEYETPESLVEASGGKLSMSQLRWALRFREDNGLDVAVVKFGKRIYIHRPTFMRLVFGSGRGAA